VTPSSALVKMMYMLMLTLSIVMLAACSKPSEAEQLAELRDSFTYKQYRRISENGLALGLQAYLEGSKAAGVKELPKITPDHLCALRLALAYSETLKKKYTVAIAETDIVDADANCLPIDRAVAASIRAIAFQNLEWTTLAIAESRKARDDKTLSNNQDFAVRAMMVHLAFGYLHISEKEWTKAKFHLDGIAVLVELPWISKVGDFGLAVQEKRLADALRIAHELSKDPAVPKEVRLYFDQLYQKAGGDMVRMAEDPAYLAEMISKIIWNAVKAEGSAQWKNISGYVDSFDSEKFSAGLKDAMDKAKDGIDSLLKKDEKAKDIQNTDDAASTKK
jgi:hypothetical protein